MYTAGTVVIEGTEVVQLADAATVVSIAPALGNIAYEMKVRGQNVLWSPHANLSEWKKAPGLLGIPLLSPWANRIDGDAFWANGHRYTLNPTFGNVRRDAFEQPIHGLVWSSGEWKITGVGADGGAAWYTARLDFTGHPQWMAQFPFAHAIEMTYRLAAGVLQVHTVFENQSAEPMPLVIGFHPYFTLPGVARDQWRVHLAAREHVKLSDRLTPTGEREPVSLADPLSLQGTQLDDVFTRLDEADQFWVDGGGKRVSVRFGPKYTVAVVYAPAGKDVVCFEPMTGITNGFNLAHEGKYAELQSIPAYGRWEESFWIGTKGF